MIWLSLYYVVLNFNTNSVTLKILGSEKLEREGVYKPKQATAISSIWGCKFLKKGCLTCFNHIKDVEIEVPSIT